MKQTFCHRHRRRRRSGRGYPGRIFAKIFSRRGLHLAHSVIRLDSSSEPC